MTTPQDIPQADRNTISELFEADRAVHFYGIGDLSDLFWNRSRWWARNGVTIGEVGLSDDPADKTVYGINTGDSAEALSLWVDVDTLLPDSYFATGVSGFAPALSAHGRTIELDLGEHKKMTLSDRLAPAEAAGTKGARPLTQDDLGAIERLHRIDPVDSAFFSPALLDAGPFYGVFEDEDLIAMAGIHLCDDELSVAAVGGVLTRHDHRGRGLARATTASVTQALVDLGIDTIGLNVMASNAVARTLYGKLGYQDVHTYQEALVVRR
jgi:RimJ/RimL family protein N-acetyltransferase